MQKCRSDVFEFSCKFKEPSGQDRTAAETELHLVAEIFSVEIKQKTSMKKVRNYAMIFTLG